MCWGLQPAEGLRTSLCPGEGANPSSKPVLSVHVHAQNHFPLGQICCCPEHGAKGFQSVICSGVDCPPRAMSSKQLAKGAQGWSLSWAI